MCNHNNTTTTEICQECESTGCKVFLTTDCVTLSEDLSCSNILKGQTLSETIRQLDAYICTKFNSIPNFFELINAGTTGARVYKGVNMLGKKELRRLVDSNLINIVEGTNDITISVDEVALAAFIANISTADGSETKIISGTPNVVIEGNGMEGDEYVINVEQSTASNVGITGAGVFKELSSYDYKFRKIKSTDNSVTITQGIDDINLSVAPSTFLTDTPVVLASGKTLGKYTNGQTILSAGKTFEEVIKDIALEYVSPAFSSFSITGQPTTVEVGTTLSGSKTFTWGITLNSGVVPTIDIYDNTASATLLAATPNDGTQAQAINTIQLNANNATQSWKGIANNSNGANVESGNFVVTSLFNRFWGAVATLPASSVDGTANRAYANLLTTDVKTNGTNTFTLVTGTTSNKFIVLLPPDVTIVNVTDTGNLGLDITSSYILSTITIKDAGGTDRAYNQYLFNPAGAYPTTTNHVITTN